MTLTRSEDPEIRVEGSERDLADVTVTTTGNTVRVSRIHDDDDERTPAELGVVEVTIGIENLHSLAATAGSDAVVAGFDDAVDRTLDVSGGANGSGAMTATVLRVSASGGSSLDLEGEATTVEAEATGGADIDLSRMRARTGVAVASGGGQITLSLSERLDACTATGGGDVSYTAPASGVGVLSTDSGGRCRHR